MEAWIRPALFFMLIASSVSAASFGYVYVRIARRRWVLVWTLAWLVSIARQGFAWVLVEQGSAVWAWLGQELCSGAVGVLLAAGCAAFEGRALPQRTLALAMSALLGWVLVAPHFFPLDDILSLPSALVLGGSLVWGGLVVWKVPRRGARALSVLFLASGLHELDGPFLAGIPWVAPFGYALAGTFALGIALFLLLNLLEDARSSVDRARGRLESLLGHLPVAVVVVDGRGRVAIANSSARELLGPVVCEPESALAERESQLFASRGGAALLPSALPLRAALEDKRMASPVELTLRREDGGALDVVATAAPLTTPEPRGESGFGAVLVLQDLSELGRLREKLARADRLRGLGTLAAGVAHDVNNMLAMILGHAELALSQTVEEAPREALQMIVRVAADGASVVRRIQDAARLRTGRGEALVDLSKVAHDVLELTRPRWRDEAHARGATFVVEPDLAEGVFVSGEESELREGVMNLVMNALDAMPSGGRLRVETRAALRAELAVSDTGGGVPEALRERIFDPFFTTKGARGTGLGLALVMGMTLRHEGELTLDSEVGRGSTFRLSFPLREAPRVAPAPEPAPPTSAAYRILVVDDEPLVRSAAARLLRRAGHTVVEAENGAAALALGRQRSFDLVLTDLGMEGMNGHELAAALGTLSPRPRVVLVTGWGDTAHADPAVVDGVLPKPFDSAGLARAVRDAMAPVASGKEG